jgi:extradiol dioxygenase family protein
MFGGAKAFGSFAVDDTAAARKFYGETLGVRVSDEDGPSCSTSPVTNAS